MVELFEKGAYLLNGTEIVPENAEAPLLLKSRGITESRETLRKGTIASSILRAHDTGAGNGLRIRFDKLISHDITYVGIIQTARASGLTEFPVPYVLTNCHNSLCAVGGTINEDDHLFGLTAAQKYGGIYVPPMQAVIHQYAREMLAECGAMILGSDSHTRYGALGTMAVGEGGPELVKQLLRRTYDIADPDVVGVYLEGAPVPGVGPQDVAIALIGAVFANGYVKNKVLEFVGPGIASLRSDFRIGIDVMTTETTCLSSIWQTDGETRKFYEVHGRPEAYKELAPADCAYYDRFIRIDLSKIRPMIAMPYHPSCAYAIEDVLADPAGVLGEAEERAKVSFGDAVKVDLKSKIRDGRIYVDQGIIAGCAGGGFDNLCAAADILRGRDTGNGIFSLSVYPASTPVYRALLKNGALADLTDAGAIVKPAFCGPCFGAGDTPANNAFSIRHSTRNFPNREGSKVQNGQIASVALMDARSIAATAANHGVLTPATEYTGTYTEPEYAFESAIYEKRVYNGFGKAQPETELVCGPNIKDWPEMPALPENLLLSVVCEIHDPVTATDELIPSGETSSLRSNPEALSQHALSRKDPAYVGLAKEIRAAEQTLLRKNGAAGEAIFPEVPDEDLVKAAGSTKETITGIFNSASYALKTAKTVAEDAADDFGIGSVIFAVKPGDGSAREQAASCQKVLGGWANIAREYATKRYRSNLINWGMLPFVLDEAAGADTAGGAAVGENGLPFRKGDWLFVPGIREAIRSGAEEVTAYVLRDGKAAAFRLSTGPLTDAEREIILKGCLINYYRA